MAEAGVIEGSKILKINEKKDFGSLEDLNEALDGKPRSRFELIDPEGGRSVLKSMRFKFATCRSSLRKIP